MLKRTVAAKIILVSRYALGACALSLCSPVAADVPLTMTYGYPMVPVEIAGRQQIFVLDTGAEGSAVYPEMANELRLPVATGETLVGQTGSAELPNRTITSLQIDGHLCGPLDATELPARRDGLRLAGIVGLDVIGNKVLDLDVPHGRAALLDGEAATNAIRLLGKRFHATRVTGGLLAIPIRLNGITGWAVIDTGARETRVNSVFARTAKLVADSRPARAVSGATQNSVAVTSARVREARFLGKRRLGTHVGVVDLPVFKAFGLADRPAMLLGIDWLSDHRLLIDFRAGSVWSR